MPDQTLKKKNKKKNCMELEFQEIEFNAKIFTSIITPYSGSPIVAFLSSIVTFSGPIAAFLSPHRLRGPIVTFSGPIAAFSCKNFL